MKRSLWLVLFGLVVALPAMAQVGGDGVRVQQMTGARNAAVTADSLTKLLRADQDGNLKTTDANFGGWGVLPNIINNQLTASSTGLQDSSSVWPTASYKRMALVLYGTPDSLSTVVRLAVQVRGHYTSNSDSAAAFPWYRWPVSSQTVASDVDSIGHMTKGSYSLAQSTNANTAATSGGIWSGEFIVKFDVARQDTTDGASGLGKFGAYPKGMYIPLTDHGGNAFWAPFTSIRVRVLNGVRSRFKIKADLVGMQ